MPEISAEKPKIFEFFKIEKQGGTLTIELTSENFILCEVSEITKDRLKRFGCEKILTII